MKKLFCMFTFIMLFISDSQSQPLSYGGIEGKNSNSFTKVSPPTVYTERNALAKVSTSSIVPNYDSDFPAAAKPAVQYAFDIWSYLLNSDQTITVDVKWENLDNAKALAQCGPTSYEKDFQSAPKPGTLYPIALAEMLSHQDLNDGDEEIELTVNSSYSDWYYGTDGNPPAGKFDFVSIIMHEIAHGFGFINSFNFSSGVGSWGSPPSVAIIYDKACVVGDNQGTSIYRLTNTTMYPNPSQELGAELISNNIYFDGIYSYWVNGNSLPKLYTPSEWKSGSSIAHLDEEAYLAGNSNSLMTYSIGYAEAIHSPGELGLTMLEDLGWSVNRIVTVTSPAQAAVWGQGSTHAITWTDSKGGDIFIDLYKKNFSGGYEWYSTLMSGTSSKGSGNMYDWTVATDLPNGDYKLKMLDNTSGYGMSAVFTISNLPTVEAPQFNPPGNRYSSSQSVSITCTTAGAEIRYTTDGTEPTTSSPLYSSPITVSTSTWLRARGFKSGYNPSPISNAVYIIGQGSTVVNILHIDEGEESFGGFSTWDLNRVWTTWSSPTIFYLDAGDVLTIYANPDYRSGTTQKFWRWEFTGSTSILYDNLISNLYYVGGWRGGYFKNAVNAIIQAQLIDGGIGGGVVEFKDPWLPDQYSTFYQKSMNQSLAAPFKAYPSPLNPNTNPIGSGSEFKGVLNDQLVIPNSPYYSVRVLPTQEFNINGGMKQGNFVGWSSENTDITSPNNLVNGYYESPVVFKAGSNRVVTARYKGHLVSTTSAATANSSQRKVVRSGSTTYAVYQSAGMIWYTQNSGTGWTPEVAISPTGTAKNPSIGTTYGPPLYVHIVWEDNDQVWYRRSTDGGLNWGNAISIGFNETSDATPVVSSGGTGSLAVVAWKCDDLFQPGTIAILVEPQRDNATVVFVPNTNETSNSPSLDCWAGSKKLVYSHNNGQIIYQEFSVNQNNFNDITFGYSFDVTSGTALTNSSNPSVASDGSNIFVSWDALNGSMRHIFTRERNASGVWQTTSEITHGTHQMSSPSIGIDATNSFVNVMFLCGDHIGRSARSISSSTWSNTAELGQGYAPSLPNIIFNSTLISIWTKGLSAPYSINTYQHTVPPAPVLISPTNGTTNLPLSVTLSWSTTFDAEKYHLQVATNPAFTGTLVKNDTNVSTTSFVLSGLSSSTQYYWRVAGININGEGSFSNSYSFTTQQPLLAPVLISPSNGATNVATSLTFTWQAATGALTYNFHINNSSGTDVRDFTGISGTSLPISGLSYYTTYYWKVKSVGEGGQTSNWSLPWSFVTQTAPSSGGCPFVFGWNGVEFFADNNILPQSEYEGNENKIVTDHYKLLLPPKEENGRYILMIKEFEHENSSLDAIKLIAIDHSYSTDIAVTSDGKIVEYTMPFTIIDEHDGMLMSMEGKAIRKEKGQTISLKFRPCFQAFSNISEDVSGGILLGGWNISALFAPAPPPKEEKIGTISSERDRANPTPFTFRQRPTLVYVPLEKLYETFTAQFDNSVAVDYANLVVNVPSLYITHELPLVAANHSSTGNVVKELVECDGMNAKLQPGESIRLEYEIPSLVPGMIRSFLLSSNGRYEYLPSLTDKEIPATYNLYQNYPNPFNPSTVIRYQLPEDGNVLLKVFNQLGQEVTSLFDGQQEAGYYERTWDASASGGGMPSGIYYVRLYVSDQFGKHLYSDAKKIVVMK